MVEEADRIGLPVISHIYPRDFSKGGTIVHDPENTMWAVRCGIECGADVIKVPFTGDPASFAKIVASSPVPVVAAGGPRCENLRSALEMMTKVVESGAWGSTIGRNIWGAPDPTRALIAFRAVIHDQMAPDAALEAAGLSSRPRGTRKVREVEATT
jgi:class I fructose-bisphosphate aldolase